MTQIYSTHDNRVFVDVKLSGTASTHYGTQMRGTKTEHYGNTQWIVYPRIFNLVPGCAWTLLAASHATIPGTLLEHNQDGTYALGVTQLHYGIKKTASKDRERSAVHCASGRTIRTFS